jgi:signal transduction histidine kinase
MEKHTSMRRGLQKLAYSPLAIIGILIAAISLAIVISLITPLAEAIVLVMLVFVVSAIVVCAVNAVQHRAWQAAALQRIALEGVLRELRVAVIFNDSLLVNNRKSNHTPVQFIGFDFEKTSRTLPHPIYERHFYQAGLVAYASAPLNYRIIPSEQYTPIDKELLRRHDLQSPIIVSFRSCVVQNVDGAIVTQATLLRDEMEQMSAGAYFATFGRIITSLSAAQTIDEIAPSLLEDAFASSGIVVFSIYLVDEIGENLRLVSHKGLALPHQILSLSNTVPSQENLIVDSYLRGDAIWIATQGNLLHQFGSYEPEAEVVEVHELIEMLADNLETIRRFDGTILKQRAWALKTGCGLPLHREGRTVGVLAFAVPFPQESSESLQQLNRELARFCEQTIHRIHMEGQTKEAAAIQERYRLARDLHDAVSQTLFSASLTAETLLMEWDRQSDDVRPHIQRLAELTQGAFAEMRTLLVELRPDALVRAPLAELLQHLITAAQARQKIGGELIADSLPLPLPPKVQIALYRIAQESVNNLLKHSHANLFRIELRSQGDEISLRVSDDGVGFDATQSSTGIGLGSMRERADEIGATLEIESAAGEGATITVTWRAAEGGSMT